MKAAVADLRARLPRLAPEVARLQTALIALLHDRVLAGGRMLAAVAGPTDRAAAQAWLLGKLGADAVAVAPLLAGGRVPRLLDAGGGIDGVALAATLAPLGDLIDLVERQLGRVFVAGEAAGQAPDAAVVLRLDWREPGDGPVRDVMLLAISCCPVGPAALSARGSAVAALGGRVAVPLALRLVGPAVTLPAVARLGPGDLVLLGRAPVAARLEGGGRALAARLDGGRVTVGQAEEQGPMGEGDEVAVPLEAVLSLPAMTLAAIAGLAPGAVVPLPAAGDGDGDGAGLAVVLRAGGAVVGHGVLVAVGDGYGVLVRDVAGGGNAGAA